MKNLLMALFLAISAFVSAQEKFTISGYVKDQSSGEELIGATVFVKELGTGVISNVYGFYSITLLKGEYNIRYGYLGFQDKVKKVVLDNDITLNVELGQDAAIIQEVIVEGKKKDENVQSIEMSVAKMDIGTIKKMPALLGEVDVIKSIQTLPGVSTVGEGASGFNVRGGGVDQNLVLLDEAPVFNSSHLFGFFSVFNPDAVKDVKLLKGGIPAQFGGRLSSLLDIRMKDGNKKRLTGSGGIGALFSRFALEGPLKKDTASFILAGRRSYIDYLAKPFFNENLRNQDIKFYFYDATLKVNWNLNSKNRFFLSSYYGRDVIDIGFGFNWGNTTTSFRWNHIFGEKLFSNFTAIYSNYDYAIRFGSGDNAFDWSSNIINYSFKPEFTWYVSPKNTVTFGGQSTYFTFAPGNAISTSNGIENDISMPEKYALENALYAGNEQKISNIFTLAYGLRYSFYYYLGAGTAYTYGDTTAGYRRRVTVAQEYNSNEVIQFWDNFEPRFSLNYKLNEKSSLKGSYNRMSQYLHLVSNTTASTPLDLWTPSTNNIKPQVADQGALGYFRNFKNDTIEASVEVYYKYMRNQMDYIDGASLLLNPFIEGELLSGTGRAYGTELYIKKTMGKVNGWISYTFARTERQVNGINNNNWYPNRFDKLHNFNTTVIYDVTKKLSLSANWVYTSGTPVTFPNTKYEVQGIVIPHNSGELRNHERVPEYHRLDLAATFKLKTRKRFKRDFNQNLVLAFYNVYMRKNAFSIYFRQNADIPSEFQGVQFSIISTIVPAITYNFDF